MEQHCASEWEMLAVRGT